MPAPDLSAADCEAIFHAALAAGDTRGVEAALALLAVRDPNRAGLLYDTLRVGLAIAQERDNNTSEEN